MRPIMRIMRTIMRPRTLVGRFVDGSRGIVSEANRQVRASLPRLPQRVNLRVGFGFAEADDPVAIFPLTTAFENFDAFEAFQNVAFGAQSAGALKTTMLSHKIISSTSRARDGTCTTRADECNRLFEAAICDKWSPIVF